MHRITTTAASPRRWARPAAFAAVMLASCGTLIVTGAAAAPSAKQTKHAKHSKTRVAHHTTGSRHRATHGRTTPFATNPVMLSERTVDTPIGAVKIRTYDNGKTCLVGPRLDFDGKPATAGASPSGFSLSCHTPNEVAQGYNWSARNRDIGNPVTAWGQVPDGVQTVTLGAGSSTITVPVTDNIWTTTDVPWAVFKSTDWQHLVMH